MSLLKAPICSVMGHVDAGKTSLIDIIKKSNIYHKNMDLQCKTMDDKWMFTPNYDKQNYPLKEKVEKQVGLDT